MISYGLIWMTQAMVSSISFICLITFKLYYIAPVQEWTCWVWRFSIKEVQNRCICIFIQYFNMELWWTKCHIPWNNEKYGYFLLQALIHKHYIKMLLEIMQHLMLQASVIM